eukprot:comp21237_c0_seq1/m.45332 comp21237_c0_seq1/g.45332  ORF comp21237_c0_seq1/g.45332 comp21237_c0_seq1/m.45332 type:complete len:404 (-) comp21237_c0_seq1:14-1225(-)
MGLAQLAEILVAAWRLHHCEQPHLRVETVGKHKRLGRATRPDALECKRGDPRARAAELQPMLDCELGAHIDVAERHRVHISCGVAHKHKVAAIIKRNTARRRGHGHTAQHKTRRHVDQIHRLRLADSIHIRIDWVNHNKVLRRGVGNAAQQLAALDLPHAHGAVVSDRGNVVVACRPRKVQHSLGVPAQHAEHLGRRLDVCNRNRAVERRPRKQVGVVVAVSQRGHCAGVLRKQMMQSTKCIDVLELGMLALLPRPSHRHRQLAGVGRAAVLLARPVGWDPVAFLSRFGFCRSRLCLGPLLVGQRCQRATAACRRAHKMPPHRKVHLAALLGFPFPSNHSARNQLAAPQQIHIRRPMKRARLVFAADHACAVVDVIGDLLQSLNILRPKSVVALAVRKVRRVR